MRYAVISDIHGNINALRAVLDDAKDKGINSYIFLGDYITSLPFPNEVIETIKQIENKHVICGNSEEYVFNLEKHDQDTWNDIQFYSLYWSYRELTQDNREYTKQLPVNKMINDGITNIYAFHSANHYFKDTSLDEFDCNSYKVNIDKTALSNKEYIDIVKEQLRNDQRLKERLTQLPDGIYAHGHNHIQMHIQIGNKLIINPGSCGVPLDLSNYAAYSILETNGDTWHVQEQRIPYDLEQTIKQFKESDLYNYAKVWSDILIMHLNKGRGYDGDFLKFISKYTQKPYTHETWTRAYELWSKIES